MLVTLQRVLIFIYCSYLYFRYKSESEERHTDTVYKLYSLYSSHIGRSQQLHIAQKIWKNNYSIVQLLLNIKYYKYLTRTVRIMFLKNIYHCKNSQWKVFGMVEFIFLCSYNCRLMQFECCFPSHVSYPPVMSCFLLLEQITVNNGSKVRHFLLTFRQKSENVNAKTNRKITR